MKKIILALSLAVFAVSCAKKETPKMIEGEILKVITSVNEKEHKGVTFFAYVDTKQDGEKQWTEEVKITDRTASLFNQSMLDGYKPYFVRLKKITDNVYDLEEVAGYGYDVPGGPPYYQFQSDKKIVWN